MDSSSSGFPIPFNTKVSINKNNKKLLKHIFVSSSVLIDFQRLFVSYDFQYLGFHSRGRGVCTGGFN